MSTAPEERRIVQTVYFASPSEMAAQRHTRAPRWLLWIDSVGGFLVCEGSEVQIGQAVPGNDVDVPLLADISRHHASIRRDEEGYLIEAAREVRVDGRATEGMTWLGDGSTIELGSTVRFQFRRPHPLSGTARLDLLSHHRTQPAAAAILLMADTCVLGPSSTCHVTCRNWNAELMLFRRDGKLSCRSEKRFSVDGAGYDQVAPIEGAKRIEGDRFCLSIERI